MGGGPAGTRAAADNATRTRYRKRAAPLGRQTIHGVTCRQRICEVSLIIE